MQAAPELKFDITQDQAKADRGLPSYTFTINGAESLVWSPTKRAAERIVNRLRLGRSGEAFGGAGLVTPGAATALTRGHDKPPRGKIVTAGEAVVEEVTTKSGRAKAREKRPAYVAELDGKALEHRFTSEADAKAFLAGAAFVSRGKLGRRAEAEAAFKDQFGKAAKVQVINAPGTNLHRKIVAKDEQGGIWSVGLVEGKAPTFKQIIPARPGK